MISHKFRIEMVSQRCELMHEFVANVLFWSVFHIYRIGKHETLNESFCEFSKDIWIWNISGTYRMEKVVRWYASNGAWWAPIQNGSVTRIDHTCDVWSPNGLFYVDAKVSHLWNFWRTNHMGKTLPVRVPLDAVAEYFCSWKFCRIFDTEITTTIHEVDAFYDVDSTVRALQSSCHTRRIRMVCLRDASCPDFWWRYIYLSWKPLTFVAMISLFSLNHLS